MEQKKPRWEVKYENLLSQEPISEKIANIEKSTKSNISKVKGRTTRAVKKLQTEIENLKNEKVTGDFKTKEEYEQAVANHKALISNKENEITELKNKSKTEIEEIKNNSENNKELQDYKNYEKNKDKIKNILEYRNELMGKLDKLPKNTAEEMNNKKKEQQARALRIEQYQMEIEDIKSQLKGELEEGDKQILLLTLKTRMDAMGDLQEKQAITDREIADLDVSGKDFNEKSQAKKDLYERRIAKCNIIAANLLRGKELGEFELNVDSGNKTYTSPDGKLHKNIEKAKNEKLYEYEKETGKFVEVKEKKQEEKQVKEANNEPVIDNGEELQNNQIATVSNFAMKYPFLAKIGNFFKNMKNKVVSVFKNNGKEEGTFTQRIVDRIAKAMSNGEEPTKTDAQEKEEHQISDEDVLLNKIARAGKDKTFRDMLVANRTAEANRLAREHGGKYEKQDGATEKKTETPIKDEER